MSNYSLRVFTFLSFFLALQAVSGVALAEFTPVDLSASVTTHHDWNVFDHEVAINRYGGGRGFEEWFTPGSVSVEGIPFTIPAEVLDCVSGSLGGKETYRLPAVQAPVIYMLGTGHLIDREACDHLELFNIEVLYADGASEEILPVNLLSRKAAWYDGSVMSVAAQRFETDHVFMGNAPSESHITVYAIAPSHPERVVGLLFNDNDAKGDFVIVAMTASTEVDEWIKEAQKTRSHQAALAIRDVVASTTRLDDKLLVDISPYCNQSADTCIETGYGLGRGEIKGLNLYPGSGTHTIDGIPFAFPESSAPNARNVISGSTKGLDSFTVPLDTEVTRIYLAMARFSDTTLGYYGVDWADNPYYFSVDVTYSDGERDTFFPRNLHSGNHSIEIISDARELAAYVVEPIADKEVKSVTIHDNMDDSDFVIAGITLDTAPAAFTIPMNPAVVYRPLPEPTSPVVTVGDQEVVVENAFYRIVLDTAPFLRLASLFNKIANNECLRDAGNPNLVSVVLLSDQEDTTIGIEAPDISVIGQQTLADALVRVKGEKRYELADFSVERVDRLAESRGDGVALHLSPKDGAAFSLEIEIRANSGQDIHVSTQVVNSSAELMEFKVFNYLSDIVIGDPENTYYFYPPPRGTIDNKPFSIRKVYGGAAYMQLLNAFNPAVGSGIYIHPDDTWGQGKALSLSKVGANPLVDDAWASYDPDVYLPKPEIEVAAGIYMGFEYWQRLVGPGQESAIPTFIIGFHTGDWHPAFYAYRDWVHANLQKRETPQWVKSGSLMSTSHIGMHLGDAYYMHADSSIDVYLIGMWWNLPDKPGTGGRREYFYREDWGGAESFRKAVAEAQQRGVRVILYLEGLQFPAQFVIGEDGEWLQKTARLRKKDGTQANTEMCPGADEWQDYLAETCGRAIRDTGADGIYLDSIAQVPPLSCYDPGHNHAMVNQSWNHDVKTLLGKVRDAIKKENPEAVLYTEAAGSDIMMTQLDGAYSYYPDFDAVTPNRFNNPKLTPLTHFLFPGTRNWALVDSLIEPAKNYEAFFNGDAISIQSSIGVAHSSVSPHRLIPPPTDAHLADIMTRHVDYFSSANSEPMLPSLFKGVYINKFPKEADALYTVFNSNFYTVRGPLIEVDGPGDYTDEVSGLPAHVVLKDGKYYLSGRVGPKMAACFVQNPTH